MYEIIDSERARKAGKVFYDAIRTADALGIGGDYMPDYRSFNQHERDVVGGIASAVYRLMRDAGLLTIEPIKLGERDAKRMVFP